MALVQLASTQSTFGDTRGRMVGQQDSMVNNEKPCDPPVASRNADLIYTGGIQGKETSRKGLKKVQVASVGLGDYSNGL